MKCPKGHGELETCLCCNAKTLCRQCKACYGYKPAPVVPPLLKVPPAPPWEKATQ